MKAEITKADDHLRVGFHPENDNDETLLELLIEGGFLGRSESGDDTERACGAIRTRKIK
jgi:hypothetical protein